MAPGGATVTPAAASRLGDEATARRGDSETCRAAPTPASNPHTPVPALSAAALARGGKDFQPKQLLADLRSVA
jgi:hypothetical protein